MTYSSHLHPCFKSLCKRDRPRAAGSGSSQRSYHQRSLRAGTILLFLLAILLYAAPSSAQLIVPKRDIQPVDSTNKTTTPSATVLKKWYTLISNKDGRYLHTYLPSFLVDSIHVDTGGLGGGDYAFWLPDSATPVPSPADSAVRTGYTLFDGLSGGLQTKIEALKEGALRFSKFNDAENDYHNWLILQDIQTDQDNVPWYSWLGSTGTIYDDYRNFTITEGFNLAGGGGAVVAGKPAWGQSWEYHFPNSPGQILSEWHRMYVDSSGVQYRIESVIIDHGDLDSWYKYYTLHRNFYLDPNNGGVWLDMYRDGTAGANIKLLASGSGHGASIYVAGDGDAMHFSNIGMTNPHLYLFDSGTTYVHMRYLDFVPSGNAAVSIVGLGADELATTVSLGSGLSLSGGTLNTSAASTSKWTDGGSYIYPTGNEAVHIPSYNSSATGNLNVIGAIDQTFPTSSLSNIAIGRGVGNASLTGTDNVYLGNYAGIDNTGGTGNILVGYASGENFTGSNGIAIGYQAMQTNVSATGNMAIGDRALKTATGGNNMAIGNQSLQKTNTGTGNTAVGNIALHENLSGADNVAIGKSAGQNGATGSSNVYIGANAALGASANAAYGNVAIGAGSAGSIDGDNNSYIGSNAGGQNTGDENVMIGASAGYNNLTGSGNVFIGSTAGYNETGSNKLYIDNSTTASPLVSGDFSANTVKVNGKLGFTTSGTGASVLVGRDSSNYLTPLSVGPGLSLSDNVLSVIPTGSDSMYITDDSLCIISLGDTLCVSQDSFYIQGDTSLCVISMGDTLCSPYSSTGGNIYTTNGSLTSHRTLFFNNYSLKLAHSSPYGSILFNQTGIYPMQSINGHVLLNDSSPLFELSASTQSDVYMRFNGLAAEDYSIGQDKSADALVISGGETLTGDPLIYMSHSQDSIIMYKDVQLDAGLLDGGGDIGGSGQVLTSTGTETNWVSPVSLNVPISGLIAALGSNTINNANYTQEWQWNSLGAASGLKLSSTSTAAASNGQKLFESSLSGNNTNASQTTYAGYFSNTHGGTSPVNYGVSGISNGSGYLSAGVYGLSTGNAANGVVGDGGSTGVGVYGLSSSSSGYAGYFSGSSAANGLLGGSSSAYGVIGSSTSGISLGAYKYNSTLNAVDTLLELWKVAAGTPAAGLGGAINWKMNTTSGTSYVANSIVSKWTTATTASRFSQMTITGVSAATSTDILYLEGDKRTRFNGRAEYTQGTDVASVAGAISLGYDGNVFEITGTNAITLISNVGWQNGSVVTLVFSSTASLVHGTATSGTDITLKLGGSANFSATADDTITLMLCEQGGTPAWREVSRSAN